MSHVCYFVVHFSNPGILPWYWASTKQRIYSRTELFNGIAIEKAQKNYGKNHDYPPRSFFSGDAGYIVLRADHICFWIHHWIGLKNMRFFIQSLFYTTICLGEFIFIIFKVFFNPDFVRSSFLYVFFIITSVFFCIFHFIYFVGNISRAMVNRTLLETILQIPNIYGKGVIKNLEEVFGSIWLFPLWFFPISLPLPTDGFSYPYQENDTCLAINRPKFDTPEEDEFGNLISSEHEEANEPI